MRISSYLGRFSWMYLYLGVDVHSGTRTQHHSLEWLAVESRTRVSSYFGIVIWMYLHLRVDVHWLAVESRTRVSSCLGLVSWMYLHLRVDVHSGTRTQYRSLQTPSRYPLSY
ncbi:unnamed protein product [Schistosoma margrebowiei]|uniref:Uncharacterized protein n=1 Tax=Schistosoma margrebowiei TaxID=48269 RepID=A0A183MRX5_9TREM|nr:unnamed protein product [Schistosoma margrebowiei]